jgi:hypothetical protein
MVSPRTVSCTRTSSRIVCLRCPKGSIRTEDHHIGAGVDSQALQGSFGQAVFVGKGQLAFDSGNVLARHHSKHTIGGQFGVQHFGKGWRQPVVFRVTRQIAEAKDSHGATNSRRSLCAKCFHLADLASVAASGVHRLQPPTRSTAKAAVTQYLLLLQEGAASIMPIGGRTDDSFLTKTAGGGKSGDRTGSKTVIGATNRYPRRGRVST